VFEAICNVWANAVACNGICDSPLQVQEISHHAKAAVDRLFPSAATTALAVPGARAPAARAPHLAASSSVAGALPAAALTIPVKPDSGQVLAESVGPRAAATAEILPTVTSLPTMTQSPGTFTNSSATRAGDGVVLPVPPAARLPLVSDISSLGLSHLDMGTRRHAPGVAGNVREQLDGVLDGLRERDQPLFGRFSVLSSFDRRGGGQGCIQFVLDPTSVTSYAVKFFFTTEAFQRERALYNDPVLHAMMPATHQICDNGDGRFAAPGGYVFPTFIVIERGEQLDEWGDRLRFASASGEIELVSVFQTLCNVSRRLLMLHGAGYVHRDLKPSNLLWLAHLHAWTLIDFGCTAKAGAWLTPLKLTATLPAMRSSRVKHQYHFPDHTGRVAHAVQVAADCRYHCQCTHATLSLPDNSLCRTAASFVTAYGLVSAHTLKHIITAPGHLCPNAMQATRRSCPSRWPTPHQRSSRRTRQASRRTSSTPQQTSGPSVVAFELLTGERAFGPLTPVEEITARIAGREPMPWEGPRRDELLRKLRAFNANVLECLHRDPARRPKMGTVVRGWEHVLRGATTALMSTHVTAP
jgi:hypothetical protein